MFRLGAVNILDEFQRSDGRQVDGHGALRRLEPDTEGVGCKNPVQLELYIFEGLHIQ